MVASFLFQLILPPPVFLNFSKFFVIFLGADTSLRDLSKKAKIGTFWRISGGSFLGGIFPMFPKIYSNLQVVDPLAIFYFFNPFVCFLGGNNFSRCIQN